ncbi:aerobic-type carbon monoxide dehydrogenase, middle subunit CoxM/CutM-like protein [Desulfosporosinus orientis DSM 765]|uniref:Aerobic-type carbon monoxide dehydrogenase, middle subunit CoxM/CutM-like protein n=1 Tax=Desulfosporosinus orientis (strain ATCC 19365 / DSM 765 / NCIMB 8382 / VKM B-1628 / Singapore I) TaxID=768706 RepID=G7W9H3_DESOD|nr:FAD binding domain-containing protein [Desulfosporosinus orientis]AET69890.1 aerobic-type carbon monoxide dehydrogenase, middle subunit CoxM/CutM-like protein [Desulfosporosinus orientis DSM 765]
MVKGYHPASLEEALAIRAREMVIPYAGGTDLMIKPEEKAGYLFLNKVSELKNITEDGEYIRIGAACTFTDILESDLAPAILKEAVSQIAAPAIRNLGTAGGNICNGSPKADSALIFWAADSKLRLISSQGERVIPISQFYLGRNKTSLEADELLAEILMPKTGLNHYYYKKVGARNALAISRVSFAGIFAAEGGRVVCCQTAFGAVSEVVIRRPDLDAMLIGKTIEEAKALKKEYLRAYDQAILPIRGRISAEYRKVVCMNLLRDFLESNGM